MSAFGVIRLASAVIYNDAGELLLVRKVGTRAFMQAGGKIEADEEPINTVIRELREELELVVAPDALEYLGHREALAANEPGCLVQAELFALPFSGAVAPKAEIEEIRWAGLDDAENLPLAPLTRDHVLPMMRACSFHA
ncbi:MULTISPECIES: NUDIX hydrolase [unclassified Sphingobium]|uniref:NUDIX hydrolase n=1 Tax=unclassified Sphingobium TaxID=2611147 RepID=UPI002224783E|nr:MULTISPECIES: NUDIX domain-containing protein [unclassified Sphingobium]MCW2413235.1 8-oxo-dGTP pyrophosphatase MutT (NUDIX family) [Sphingobium sp. B8D3D]MCW2414467.1 8-oxo-dGTP pyrophosphatase MutT (NUDIX family) [Sphingobium sp. B8D3A]